MRALQCLNVTSLQAQSPPAQRTNIVVDQILSALSPLVAQSQATQLRNDLLALAQSAISVWCSAQTDELQIIVYPNLDRTAHEEWCSSTLDSNSSLPENNSLASEGINSTPARVFTLFPRVIALKMSGIKDLPADALPGSWPDAHQEPAVMETCIHPGKGLPECSELVVKGKQEAEEMKVRLDEEHIQEQMVKLEKQRR
jgi:hypothetical protein